MKKRVFRLRTTAVSLLSRVNRSPIIVLGKEKSGTTAIAALLAEHTSLSVTLDIPAIWGAAETQIYAGDMAFEEFVRRNRYAFSKSIIKEPSLTFLYPQIRQFYFRARYVMIVRDPRDNARSILNRLKIRGDLVDVGADARSTINPGWQVVLDGRWLGLQGETYIEMLAERWNLATDVYLGHSAEMFLVRYEDFVSDKVGVIEDLARHLGLASVHDISGKVNAQYQRRGNRDISWEEFFGQGNLSRIERICAARMVRLGYTPGTVSPGGHAW